ncbi:MAG: RNA degradosome polyphosphate kinase, partial [Pirellulales bacterium]|nr:RNA degradosome polyphosphate kinase [Pirellulales bacterium]
MSKTKKKVPELFINRELSWLEFNDRVLREGLSPELPLLERLKFLAIVSSNLDESFMIRVAGLRQQRSAGVRRRDPSGMTPARQLTAYAERAHRMVDEQTTGIRDALAELRQHGMAVLRLDELTPEQTRFVKDHF